MTDRTGGQLGQIVAWRVPSSVSVDTLRAALAAARLNPDLAGDLHPRYVLARALRDMKSGRVICKLKQIDENTVSFQLTLQQAGATQVDYQREAVVTLDLRSSVINADNPLIETIARDLVKEHAAKRLTNDLTRLVQHVYDQHRADLIPIRDQGGAYFVPDQHRALVDQSRVFLFAIGGRLNSFAVRLGCSDTAESVAESMADYLQRLITEFRESCADVTVDSRRGVVNRRNEQAAELRRRLECYRGLLGAAATGIDTAIDEAEKELLAKIMAPVVGDTNGHLFEEAKNAQQVWRTARTDPTRGARNRG